MLESIEGKRGLPRHKPPFPSQVGLFGRPTLINNVETLFWVRDIVEKGPEWFAAHGRNGRKGLRTFSVSGRVKNPGVKLAPAGITVRELIDEYCGGMADGHTLQGLSAGRRLGRHPAGRRWPTSRSISARSSRMAASSARPRSSCSRTRTTCARSRSTCCRFFEDESCGQCTPCRVGTEKAVKLMERPRLGRDAARRADQGDDRRLDLRPRPGGDEPGEDGAEAFPRGSGEEMSANRSLVMAGLVPAIPTREAPSGPGWPAQGRP